MCSFPEIEEVYRVRPMTKYGLPSDYIKICRYAGQVVAFLPRHGAQHSIAPHRVPYKANMLALQSMGVETVVASCIAGSLKKKISPGSFVVPDQFVNLTWGRDDCLDMDSGLFTHLPMAKPYCTKVRQLVIQSLQSLKIAHTAHATVAVIQGPRFSTQAESRMFIRNGWDIVNMTQYPECYYARELGLCYAAFAAVTDYDVGVESCLSMHPEHREKVIEIFKKDIIKTKQVLLRILEETTKMSIDCGCSRTLVEAYYEQM